MIKSNYIKVVFLLRKIVSFCLILFTSMTLFGCQSVTFEYTLTVNPENPLKSLYFVSEDKAARFLGHFSIKDTAALYFTTHEIASSGNTKLTYSMIVESQNYTPDQYEIAEYRNYGGKKFVLALFEDKPYESMFSASITSGYKNYSGNSDAVILKSPYNRLKALEYVDALIGQDQRIVLEDYQDYQVLDFKFNMNADKTTIDSVSVLALNGNSLHDMVFTSYVEPALLSDDVIASEVIDAYYEFDRDAIIYINQLNILHYIDETNELKTIEVTGEIKNFYPKKAYYEGSALRYHVIETESHILFFDTALELIYDLEKDPNHIYVGLNHFALGYEAWITYYYLDHNVLKKKSLAINALR